jgi:hypothetical protein
MNDEAARQGRPATSNNTATTIALVRDALVRVTAVNEGLDCGDIDEARAVAGDLECDLARFLGEDTRPYVCVCGLALRWPGELERHETVSGHRLEVAA